jgi:hypothetical protein
MTSIGKLIKVLSGKSALMAFALFVANNAVAQRPPLKPERVLPPIHRSFLPAGFDTNDNAQLIVTGGYPNSCYMVGHTKYEIDKVTKTINVEVTAFRRQGPYCLQVYTPFQEEISVGLLDAGSYTVVVNQEPGNARTFGVREAPTASPDNHLYAPVTQIIRTGPREFLLRGNFTSSCMRLETIQVNYEAGEVIAVLPLAAYDSNCFEDHQTRPWEARFQVRSDLNGEQLLHVRSLNGDAVNSVQDFTQVDFLR